MNKLRKMYYKLFRKGTNFINFNVKVSSFSSLCVLDLVSLAIEYDITIETTTYFDIIKLITTINASIYGSEEILKQFMHEVYEKFKYNNIEINSR